MNSIMRHKERGQYGSSIYRGNCSGEIIKDLWKVFRFNTISDYACGSGTTEDVAKELKLKSNCYDLSKGFDLINDEIPQIKNRAIFYHPPYWDVVKYSGAVWGKEPHKNDLSRITDYKDFIKALNYTILKQFATLETGGKMFVLVGDIKKQGILYSMICDIVKPNTLVNILIKEQFNCQSNKVEYNNANFFRIAHEYIAIFEKTHAYIERLMITKELKYDIRKSQNITWRDLIFAVFEQKGKKSLNIEQIYNEIRYSAKAEKNQNVREKIRQTLLNQKYFKRVNYGTYELL